MYNFGTWVVHIIFICYKNVTTTNYLIKIQATKHCKLGGDNYGVHGTFSGYICSVL